MAQNRWLALGKRGPRQIGRQAWLGLRLDDLLEAKHAASVAFGAALRIVGVRMMRVKEFDNMKSQLVYVKMNVRVSK